MLLLAMNQFQVSKREYSEAKKAQYTDMQEANNGAKTYFRASELGQGDRKILYTFFKHQLPTTPKSAKNLRQLENGDYVHERYQKAWQDMGVLISMEERLTSKDDEYLAQFEWEWAGHYDGLLDMNILRAHAQGLCKLNMVKNEETDTWELEVDLDDEYANAIGIFDTDFNGESTYVPITEVADIKTMNPWGFDRLYKKSDVSEIQGYIDQISFYMYMLNTPYGSIFIENKASNDLLEVQIVWKDLHGDETPYSFDPELHGEMVDGILRVTIDNERFYGSDKVLGLVPRLEQLWHTKQLLEEAEINGYDMSQIMPPRCSEDPGNFPCSWGKGAEKCEFFDHCWNQFTNGCAIKAYEACPAEAKWEIVDQKTGEVIEIDSRKVPEGVTKEGMQALYNMNMLGSIEMFLVDAAPVPIKDAIDTAVNSEDESLFGAGGELNLGTPVNFEHGGETLADPQTTEHVPDPNFVKPKSTQAIEYTTSKGVKAIKCLNCGKELTYQRLANGGTKKCDFCNHVNKVVKE